MWRVMWNKDRGTTIVITTRCANDRERDNTRIDAARIILDNIYNYSIYPCVMCNSNHCSHKVGRTKVQTRYGVRRLNRPFP
jgi:hypothetical protein